MKFSELITKPVISLFESAVEGIVFDAIFSENSKKIKSLILENSKDKEIQDELLLHIKDVHKIGQDAIMIKNKYVLNNFEDEIENNNPINFQVFTTSGNSLGKINDFEIDNDFNITKYYCGDTIFTFEQIASINNKIILINTKEYSINVSKFKHKPKMPKNKINQKAVILPLIQNTQNLPQLFDNPYLISPQVIEINPEQKTETSSIPRLNSQNQNLVGRMITQNIISSNGELIAKQGNVVTENTIKLASAHQKLRELSFYVK